MLYLSFPYALHHTACTPKLKPMMQSALATESLGNLCPLAPTSHAENDAIENSAQIDTRAASRPQWHISENNCFDLKPKRIW